MFEPVPALQLVPEAVGITASTIENTALGLWQIITGRRPLQELGGPIKMAQVAGQVASIGWFEFVQLIAFFSINLGFINLLPVPMLEHRRDQIRVPRGRHVVRLQMRQRS